MFPIKDDRSSGIFPLINILIIAVAAIVLLVEFASPNLDVLLSVWALVPAKINFVNPQTLYPFVTAMFLHGGFMHFFSNMWFLWIFGDNVEGALGKAGYLLFYIFGGLIAGVTQYMLMIGQDVPILGASGAIAAVLGFYLIVFPYNSIRTLVFLFATINVINLPSKVVLVLWFVTQLFNGTASLANTASSGGVAWWAHVGGFVFGVAIGTLFKFFSKKALI